LIFRAIEPAGFFVPERRFHRTKASQDSNSDRAEFLTLRAPGIERRILRSLHPPHAGILEAVVVAHATNSRARESKNVDARSNTGIDLFATLPP
jgi:hypothetical protein